MQNNSPKYLNPFTDFGFKNLFGKEYSKDVLIDFLNDLYADLPGMKKIVDITYTDKEMSRLTEDGKTVIYDIRCKTEDNHHFIVEMQVNSQSTFLSRAIYYLCRAISEQGETGEKWRYDFQPVYGVYFTDFKLNGLEPKVKVHSKLCDLESAKPISDKVCLSFIQLPFFKKNIDECTTGFDQWIYVLKHLSYMNVMPFTEEKEIFKKVADISDLNRLTPEQRREYDVALKTYRDYNATISTAIENGRAEGIELGKAEGIELGKADVARNLKALGMSSAQISQVTGLSEDVIASL